MIPLNFINEAKQRECVRIMCLGVTRCYIQNTLPLRKETLGKWLKLECRHKHGGSDFSHLVIQMHPNKNCHSRIIG
jgi:hypothetical protein